LTTGPLSEAAFSGWIHRFIWRHWVHSARCTLQDNEKTRLSV